MKIVSPLTNSESYEVSANATCKDVLAPQPGENLRPLLLHKGNPPEDENWSLSFNNMPAKKTKPTIIVFESVLSIGLCLLII
jgi:hypothetical protein